MSCKVSIHKCKNIKVKLPILAWLIMLLQGMNPFNRKSYSHMAISLEAGGIRRFFDASFVGIQERTEEEFLKIYELAESREVVFPGSEIDFLDWFGKYKNNKYDFLQLVGLSMYLLKLKKSNILGTDDKKLICCELIMVYFRDVLGLDIGDSDKYDLLMTWKISEKFNVIS